MDQHQWRTLCKILRQVTRSMPRLPRTLYSDHLILRLYFWAVLNDRPMSWAVERSHYNRTFRPRQWPSLSQLNRRIAADRFQHLLQRVHQRLSRSGQPIITTAYLDGKALPLSPVTQDRQARRGYVPGGFATGYKLHALVDQRRQIPVFCVMPLNVHERTAAHQMLEHVPNLQGTLLMADGNYDSHKMYKHVDHRGGRLLTKLRGKATHEVTLRQMGRARREAIELWKRRTTLMRAVYKKRKTIERVFGRMVCTPGLLGPLPAFIRGLARVRRWVGAKICLYHVRLEHGITAQSCV